jgi:hypothetical protein
MKLRQTAFQTVSLSQSEFSLVQRADRTQNVERPASLFSPETAYRWDWFAMNALRAPGTPAPPDSAFALADLFATCLRIRVRADVEGVARRRIEITVLGEWGYLERSASLIIEFTLNQTALR